MPRVSKGSVYRQKGSENWFIKFYLDGKPKRESAGTPHQEQAVEFLRQRIERNRRLTPTLSPATRMAQAALHETSRSAADGALADATGAPGLELGGALARLRVSDLEVALVAEAV